MDVSNRIEFINICGDVVMKKYIFVLSVISSFAVVMMHVNGIFWTFSSESYWVTANFIECVCYFAVPVFFMISGANLIEYKKRYDTKTYLKKRIVKTLLPYLIWSMIGCVYQIHLGYLTVESLSIRTVINALINSEYVSVYWFFMPLFAVIHIFSFAVSLVNLAAAKCNLAKIVDMSNSYTNLDFARFKLNTSISLYLFLYRIKIQHIIIRE